MYRILKDAGNNANVTLENTDTHSSLGIGRLSMDIVSILTTEGYKIGEDIKYKDKWELEIGIDASKKLAEMAIPIKAPQRKAKEEPKKKLHKEIDAMDVLLGLATYD